MSVIFGQLVIGPPGSGKTSYCNAMSKCLEKWGRNVIIINIDPANENIEYKAAIDISELIKLDQVMKTMKLGPNGALVYCIDFLSSNIDWLITKILNFQKYYILIDCPGQVELYTHEKAMSKIIEKLSKNTIRLCCVNLIDSHYCSDPGKYLSSIIVCMSTMLHLALPHVNVMTKIDEMKQYNDKLAFNIDFYTEVLELKYLLELLDEEVFTSKYTKLNSALVSLIEDYSLVSFIPFCVKNEQLLLQVKNAVDKANGYVFGGSEVQDVQSLLMCAFGAVSEAERTSELDAIFEK